MSERREREIGPATLHFREKGGKREGRGVLISGCGSGW